jgi:hypothetical protein
MNAFTEFTNHTRQVREKEIEYNRSQTILPKGTSLADIGVFMWACLSGFILWLFLTF